jgi:hypothetical protein
MFHNSLELKMLPGRDPIKRTQVAHIDLVTRTAAKHASYMFGYVFGLMLHIMLAVEDEE